MKPWSVFTAVLPLALASTAAGQGTFIYDQQSSTNESLLVCACDIFGNAPYGQSFTPGLDSVALVRLKTADGNPNISSGATLYVNLRSDSITGTLLGSTDPITFPRFYVGITNFVFTTPVAVAPGVQYYFEIVEQAGGHWDVDAGPYNYAGGQAYHSGIPSSGSDLWFREGTFVPEPSSTVLLLACGCCLLAGRRWLWCRRAARP